jgi:hypothetical protein
MIKPARKIDYYDCSPPDPEEGMRMKECHHCIDGKIYPLAFGDFNPYQCGVCHGTGLVPDPDDRTDAEREQDAGDEEYHREKEGK